MPTGTPNVPNPFEKANEDELKRKKEEMEKNEEVKQTDKNVEIDRSLLLPGLQNYDQPNVPSDPAGVGATGLTNAQLGEPLRGRPEDGNVVGPDGQPFAGGGPKTPSPGTKPVITGGTAEPETKKLSETTRELQGTGIDPMSVPRNVPVRDPLSGNTVMVRQADVGDDIATLQAMLQAANESLGGLNISEVPLDHNYWALQNRAIQFKKERGL